MKKKSPLTHDGLNSEPYWYKSGVIYELHVRAFADSDDNGIGDFKGLTSKLDYLKDLGITALWLLPFYPSPLKDDGYDTADYFDVHPMYGTLADFKTFLKEAHKRGLRVITELVLNHTSDQHVWFQWSRRAAPGSRWRNFYVWSDTPEKYKDARIIFKDIEVSNWTHDPVAGAYFWHRFFSHQPDLNWENPEVHKEMVKVIDFWFDMGVDGLRLDAVPYLFEREGTSCENLPETHGVLKKLREHVDRKYGDRMLLAEANQWPEDAVAYFGQGAGDECHMAFHFPLMPRLFMSLRMEDRLPIVDILEQTPEIPETSQWALFLRNHDELTLEMVTDEERDYMYRVYAHVNRARLNLGIRRRLAPLLGNDRRRIELMNALLLSLPGTPVLYYGDEIGMGENIYLGDRNGVRTPMQWSSDKNAGFSRANPQALYLPIIYDPEYHYEAVNVESQVHNPHSLLWWTRRLLALRKRYRALGEGKCEFLHPENHKILAYLLTFGNETILVVANLSRFVQPVELDLSAMSGRVPVELFGRMSFPEIGEKPFFLTMSPHAFFWFLLQDAEEVDGALPAASAPISVLGDWTEALGQKARTRLEARLADWLPQQSWFPARKVRQVGVRSVVTLPDKKLPARIVLLDVSYSDRESELYSVPLAFAPEPEAAELRSHHARAVLCDLHVSGSGDGVLFDAMVSPGFCTEIFKMISKRRDHKSETLEIRGTSGGVLKSIVGGTTDLQSVPLKLNQRNTSTAYDEKFVLKWFRRLAPGTNPEIEIGEFLTSRKFAHVQRLAGSIRLTEKKGDEFSLAALSEYIPNARSAWDYVSETLGRFYERIASGHPDGIEPPALEIDWSDIRMGGLPAGIRDVVGTCLDSARVLGERTAELHLALSSDDESDAFAPEPFTPHYVRGLLQSMRNVTIRNFRALRKEMPSLAERDAGLARDVMDREPRILDCYRAIQGPRLSAKRIRCHGDLDLTQALYTGKDILLIDFEGDPYTTVSERCIKRSALRDVAGMMRSFHYAAWTGLTEHMQRGGMEPESIHTLEPWARLWYRSTSIEYLRAYLGRIGDDAVLAQPPEEIATLLPAYLFHEAMHELGSELAKRSDWLHIPLRGILSLLDTLNPGGE